MHTIPKTTRQDPVLKHSCHLALDLLDLLATSLGGKQKTQDTVHAGFDNLVRRLGAIKALTLSTHMQQKKKQMAALKEIRQVQAQYATSRQSHHNSKLGTRNSEPGTS